MDEFDKKRHEEISVVEFDLDFVPTKEDWWRAGDYLILQVYDNKYYTYFKNSTRQFGYFRKTFEEAKYACEGHFRKRVEKLVSPLNWVEDKFGDLRATTTTAQYVVYKKGIMPYTWYATVLCHMSPDFPSFQHPELAKQACWEFHARSILGELQYFPDE